MCQNISIMTVKELKECIQIFKDQIQYRRNNYLIKHAKNATIDDERVKEIVQTERAALVLSLPDYAKVQLAIYEDSKKGFCCYYPLVNPRNPDEEYIDLFKD